MSLSENRAITFNPRGCIHDVAENQELLARLRGCRELEPEELVKFAEFFKKYPTNLPLGNHLALLALVNSSNNQFFRQTALLEYNAWFDYTEDALEGINPFAEDPTEDNADGAHQFFRKGKKIREQIKLSVRLLPIAGINLLVETLSGLDDGRELSYNFIIGVAPSSL